MAKVKPLAATSANTMGLSEHIGSASQKNNEPKQSHWQQHLKLLGAVFHSVMGLSECIDSAS
jgi:hypothetical protein